LKYNNLGNSGIKVSEYCLGSMTWGEASTEAEGHWQLDTAVDHGINFIDTAEMYPTNPMTRETAGNTEKIIGSWLGNGITREKVVLATKVTGEGCKTVRDGRPITGKQIKKSVNESLKRLNTDYIDLYQLHWPNRGSYHFRKYWAFDATDQSSQKMEDHVGEVTKVLSEIIVSGKIRAIGLSNESAWGTMKFLDCAKKENLSKIVTIQNEYSLLCRIFDTDLAELSHHENVKLLCFSPLGAGLLTGKYQNNNVPKGSRLDVTSSSTPGLSGRIGPNTFKAVNKYLQVAKKHSIDLAHMALSFCCSRPFMGSVIFGATKNEQLLHILKGCDLKLSDEILRDINDVYRNNPMPI